MIMLEIFFKDTSKFCRVYQNQDQGMATTNNDLFLRLWFEVDLNKSKFNAHSRDEAIQSNKKVVSL